MKTRKIPDRIYGYILHQIMNEKRSNWALLAELLIVSCVVWYLVDSTYVMIVRAMEPTGFDTSNCYRVDIGLLDEGAVGYDVSRPHTIETKTEDMVAIGERLRHDEDIEAAAYSMRDDPCGYASLIVPLNYDTVRDARTVCIYEPDFLRVFRIRSVDGKSPEELAALLKDRNMFASEGILGENYDMQKLIGKEMKVETNDNLPRKLVAVLPPMKKTTTCEAADCKVVVIPFRRNNHTEGHTDPVLSIRVKDNRAEGFAERFREKIKNKGFRAGNYYISGISSYKDLIADDESEQKMRMRFYGVATARGNLRSIELYASVGYTGQERQIADAYAPLKDYQMVQVGVRIPLIDWGRRRGEVRVAESNRETVRSQLRLEQQTFDQNLFILVEQLNNRARQLRIAEEADSIAERRYETNIATFMAGSIPALELNDAQQARDAARQERISRLYDYWYDLYRLRSLTLWDFVANRDIDADIEEIVRQ